MQADDIAATSALHEGLKVLREAPHTEWIRSSALFSRSYLIGMIAGMEALLGEDLPADGEFLRAFSSTLWGTDEFSSTPLGSDLDRMDRGLDALSQGAPGVRLDQTIVDVSARIDRLDAVWRQGVTHARNLLTEMQLSYERLQRAAQDGPPGREHLEQLHHQASALRGVLRSISARPRPE